MDIESIVFGLSVLMVLVCFLPPLAGRLGLPYSVVLAIGGVLLSYLSHVHSWNNPFLHEFVGTIRQFQISSEAILLIFLPVLLFETALAMHVRRLIEDIGPIMLMAVVAVLISTIVVGLFLSGMSDHGLVACMMLGAIIATTDPAAVVGIFKDVGAPKRLMTLVEGESLLNDAAAIAIYSVMLGLLSGDLVWTGGLVIKSFIYLFIGGGVAGYLIGRLTCMAFSWTRGWKAAEVTLTLSTAYLSYFVSEHFFGVSGVVATVVAGLVVGSTGRTRMSASTFEILESSWSQFGFWANSLIFLFAAMLIPKLMATIDWDDGRLILVIFLGALLARALTVFGLIPLLTRLVKTNPVSTPYKTVIWWGGLRGAVSIALALAVTEKTHISQDTREFIAVAVTGFVLMTLFINGLTLRPLINLLGLNQLTPRERALRDQAVLVTTANIQHEADAIGVREQVSVEVRDRIREVFSESLTRLDDTLLSRFTEEQRVSLGLSILSKREVEIHFKALKDRVVDQGLTEMLIENGERLDDAARAKGVVGYQKVARTALSYPMSFRLAMWAYAHLGVGRFLSRALGKRFALLVCMRSVCRKMDVFAKEQLTPLLGDVITQQIQDILQDRYQDIEDALQALKLQYPGYAVWLEEHYLGLIARNLEMQRYKDLHDHSLITGEVYDDVIAESDARWAFLSKEPPLDTELTAADLVMRVPLLQGLKPGSLKAVTRLLKPKLFLPGDLVMGPGSPNVALYFVASGAVSLDLPDGTSVEFGSGEFFGEMYLISSEKPEFEVRSLGYSKLLVLAAKDFRSLAMSDKALSAEIERVGQHRLAAYDMWRREQRQPGGETVK